jgi:type II secretory pathway component GspD/PulD (secretin)
MVELGVNILEVDTTDTETLGLDWDAWKTSAAGIIQISSASRDSLGGEFFSFDTLLGMDATTVAEFLNYLVRQGHATVVTNTNMTVVNGQTATLESARVIPYQTYDRIDGTAAPVLLVVEGDTSDPLHIPTTAPVPGSAAGRAELRDQMDVSEGFTLTFTPIIGQDSMVCRVECVINSLIGHTELDMPITSAYRTESMVGLVDGGTCLLGAFDKQTIMEIEDGIPLLRNIPYLGYLFSEVTEEVRTSKLVVILTPRINEHLTYTDEAVLNGRRIPGPSYDPYTSPPCVDCPPVFRDALQAGQNAIDDAMSENEAEWR